MNDKKRNNPVKESNLHLGAENKLNSKPSSHTEIKDASVKCPEKVQKESLLDPSITAAINAVPFMRKWKAKSENEAKDILDKVYQSEKSTPDVVFMHEQQQEEEEQQLANVVNKLLNSDSESLLEESSLQKKIQTAEQDSVQLKHDDCLLEEKKAEHTSNHSQVEEKNTKEETKDVSLFKALAELAPGVKTKRWLRANPTRLIPVSFFLVIFIGACLLTLPIASNSGNWTSFLTALFTATSATCVTGLVLVDTATYWSHFGQIVILTLIQIGALGLVTIMAFALRGTHRKMRLSQVRVLQETTGSDSLTGSIQLVKRIVWMTLIFEFLGAVFLSLSYTRYFPFWSAVRRGSFQAISAYCNAGFDLMGDTATGPFSSLTAYNSDPLILLITAFLLVSGGLGFVVWIDLFDALKTFVFEKTKRALRFHTRIVLKLTLILVFGGMLFFLIFDWNQPSGTAPGLGSLPIPQKFLAAFFQSVTLRTAGFNSIDQGTLSDTSKFFSILMMFIGASPASTAGGIKLTTFAILLSAVQADLFNEKDGRLLGHRIPENLIRRAFSIFAMGLMIVVVTSFVLTLALTSDQHSYVSFIDLLYEATSAFATVGTSATGTPNLDSWSHAFLILVMFLGRVGPASFAISFMASGKENTHLILPEGRTFVG